MIETGSFTRLKDFEQCPFRAKLKYVDKLPEPQGELRPGQTEHANDRGTRVHEAAEAYVKGGVELIPELAPFAAEYAQLRTLYAEGKVSLEGEWGYDREWNAVSWRSADVWLRVKLDVMVRLSDTHALVVDLKTGKRAGNEVKHADQTKLYELATLLRYPELEEVTTELWYPDQDDLAHAHAKRDAVMRHFKRYNDRFIKMTSATEFRPNPNVYTCRFCRYGPKGSGACTVGV